MTRKVLIGIGNLFRGDDAAGLMVAQQMKQLALPDVVVLEQNGEATSLIASWMGYDQVVLVDAVQSGAEAGTVHHFVIPPDTLPAQFSNSVSSHGFGVAEAILLAEQLERLPPCLYVYGIEGVSFGLGDGLSVPVRAGIIEVVTLIEKAFIAS